MARNYWIKLKHDVLATPKIAILRDRLWRRYIEMMLFAGKTGKSGKIPPTPEMAWLLHCDPEQLETELAELASFGLLSIVDGVYHVSDYAETQAPSKHAQYMQEWREKKKDEKEKVGITR